MTHNTREVEEAAKDWLFAGDEPKPEDEVVYKEFLDFLTDFSKHQLQKARQDWLREEIVSLEGIFEMPHDGTKYVSAEQSKWWVDGYNQALQTIIDRYQEELDQDKK